MHIFRLLPPIIHMRPPGPERYLIGTLVPEVRLLSVWNLLGHQTQTFTGPDEIPYWLWRDYTDYLARIIKKIFNNSIKLQNVPRLQKLANVTPIPKVSPLSECSQLRPISLTDIIMRIFERLVYKQEIFATLQSSIGPNQFACQEGHNATVVLLKCQHY